MTDRVSICFSDTPSGGIDVDLEGLEPRGETYSPAQMAATALLSAGFWNITAETQPGAGLLVVGLRNGVPRLLRVLDGQYGQIAGISEDGVFECTSDYFEAWVLVPLPPASMSNGGETLQ